MPPPEAGEPLSDKERALLRKWINSGAEYEPRWSYTRISRPTIQRSLIRRGHKTRSINSFLQSLNQKV